MAITVKSRLDSGDIMTLLPLFVGFLVWLFVKGLRYVPR